MSSFMDVKRKDFMEMLSHHMATIALLVLSFVSNFVRIGALILVVHDTVDWWMEGAKLAKYTGYSKLTDALFIIFTIIWAITRLFIYPFYILYSVYFDVIDIVGGFPMHKIFSILLTFLQVLHIYWFYLICKMIYKYIITGSVEKDERSESEVESSENEQKNNNSLSNGKKTFFASPIGKYYKLKEKPAKAPQPIEALEQAFKKRKAIPQGPALEDLAKKTDMSTRQVERWFRRKRVSCNPSVMQKFKETRLEFILLLLLLSAL
ncbi:DgyrCDS2573 [Dimorphilus gyrociliatus]|uniref:DgyrCDS2573 n=1 Tax=Dimorphilus gyrociliatus TaxID=2664684 RepID=A0A7I8VAP2_9ANNE|nr:DgyrCDS2573 [Dimorphilus gyrociliatus]